MHSSYWKTAMAYRLKHGEPVDEGARRVAKEELQAAVRNLALPPAQRDVGIHEARKSLKRLRALLRLLGPVMGAEARLEARRLRDAARRISGFRDAAVAIETLDALCARNSAPDRWIAKFRSSLVLLKQASAGDDMDEVLAQVSSTLAKAAARVASWRITAEGDAAIHPGLKRAYRRGRKAFKAVQGSLSGEPAHTLRKRVKDLWYTVRLLEGAWVSASGLATQLKELEALLGEEHNLTMLSERLPVVAPGKPKPAWQRRIDDWIAAYRAELSSQAEAIGAQVYAEKPAAFLQRILHVEAVAA
jgi:CHAD domain-containing protein